jgi:hypothetical protein
MGCHKRFDSERVLKLTCSKYKDQEAWQSELAFIPTSFWIG